MGAMASQITGLTIVNSTVYSDADQRKHQSSASLAYLRGNHRGPVNSPHKWPVTRKMFPFDDVIMFLKLIEISVDEPRLSKTASDVHACKWGSLKPHLQIGWHQGIYSYYMYFDRFLSTVRTAVRMRDPIKTSNHTQVRELEEDCVSRFYLLDLNHGYLTLWTYRNSVWTVIYHSDRYFCSNITQSELGYLAWTLI